MAKVKLTKNALKAERDALKRFQRYLPTLLLKKQQLQMEMRTLQEKVMAKREEEDKLRKSMASWISLFADPIEWKKYLSVKSVEQGEGNIAGVKIPTFSGVEFNVNIPDRRWYPQLARFDLLALGTPCARKAVRTPFEGTAYHEPACEPVRKGEDSRV